MKQADFILDKFESDAELSRLLGHTNASTVGWWRKTGQIPGKHHPEILKAASKAGVELTPDDFVRHLRKPSKRGAEQATA